jgi:hypothetical protein
MRQSPEEVEARLAAPFATIVPNSRDLVTLTFVIGSSASPATRGARPAFAPPQIENVI